jgi:hypothetical protein
MLGINLKVGVEATLQRLNAHSKGRQFKNLQFIWGYPTAAISESRQGVTVYLPHMSMRPRLCRRVCFTGWSGMSAMS